jgi:hypothetical protein
MKRIIVIVCSVLAIALLAGCGDGSVDTTEDEDLGVGESALEISNALNPNALNPNALNPNALNPNALNPNALNPNALNPNALLALQAAGSAGEMSRQLLKYTVSCALNPTQSFAFSWTDSLGTVHSETYWGLLGLASDWATNPLSTSGAAWVSACLASRINWYGVAVTISSRGVATQLDTTGEERSSYSKLEGAFYGNLFTSTPAVYTCYNVGNIANSRSKQRDCAAGHLNTDGTVSSCGMLQILGSCGDYCNSALDAQQYYPGCFTTSGRLGTPISSVVTTALP